MNNLSYNYLTALLDYNNLSESFTTDPVRRNALAVLQQKDVQNALTTLCDALSAESHVNNRSYGKKKYPYKGSRWTALEIMNAKASIKAGVHMSKISADHGRTKDAIRRKMIDTDFPVEDYKNCYY